MKNAAIYRMQQLANRVCDAVEFFKDPLLLFRQNVMSFLANSNLSNIN